MSKRCRDIRNQGGIIDLHPKLGQLALKQAVLLEAYHKNSLPGGEASKIMKANGRVFWDDKAMEWWRPQGPRAKAKLEIDRNVLKDLSLDSLQEENHQVGQETSGSFLGQ
ncbi:hypothetical protein BJ878DRAFT_520509 [Calycina marina]|uniref:Uncharacterized protein n=1 Tax=Calycina marina TaxID=1763456 RepID=A0A9P7YXI9_9HELO|nr:hypothetical protein BJ878DRAFT_520509 [Calycina marina]